MPCTQLQPSAEDRLEQTVLAMAAELRETKRAIKEIERSADYRILSGVRQSRLFPLVHGIVRGLRGVRSGLIKMRGGARCARPTRRTSSCHAAVAPPLWRLVQREPGYPVIAICHPRWQGMRSAAEGYTPNLMLVPEIGRATASAAAECLAASGATHFITNGYFYGYDKLLTALRRQMPSACICHVHHGSFFQLSESYESAPALTKTLRLLREGVVDRLGFCKPGMAAALGNMGVPAYEIMNRVPQETPRPPRFWRRPAVAFIPADKRPLKNSHAQVLGAILSGEIQEIHVACPLDLQYLPPAALDRVRLCCYSNLSRAATQRLMRKADLVLYVSLSECAPMAPLESLAAGVPCLTGDNHSLFADFPELRQALVVSQEDDPWAIARAIQELKTNYYNCCVRIGQFNAEYDRRAAESVATFLGFPPRSEQGT
jgi:hypothetical protein